MLPPEQVQSTRERTRQAFAYSLTGCIADQEKAMEMAEAAGNAAAKLLGHMIE